MEAETNKKIQEGLRPIVDDNRDYSHTAVFGAIPKQQLPEQDFEVSMPLGIKDQGETDFCSAYAACAVSEDQEDVLLNPEYIFMKAKTLSRDPEKWGQDLRTMCKAMVAFGTIEQQYFPFLNDPQERSTYVQPLSWHSDLAGLAYEHRKNSFFNVDGPYDTFDNMRMTLWKDKEDRKSILTGAGWRDSWTKAKGGIIPKEPIKETLFGHAFKIFGQKKIDGEMHLIAQLSNGVDIGDEGIFYFPREVVNREFTFGAFTFSDMPKEVAAYYAENKINVKDGLFKKLLKVVRTIIRNYLHI